ncbi:MAG: transglutaminase-like cysteine peptidase [Pseudomonadota bacterium]
MNIYCRLFWRQIPLFVLLTAISASALALPNYRYIPDRALDGVYQQYGNEARSRVSGWRDLLNQLAAQVPPADLEYIEAANDYFNQVQWLWDIDHWGQEDYWATPIETLASNGGDCEDYSIGKYFSLTSIGMKTAKLRITYVKALEYDLAHMVLAYYPSPASEPLILDNINKTILPASKRKDLLPIYSFNGDGLWLAKSRARAVKGDVSKNLPSWGNLKGKMEREML